MGTEAVATILQSIAIPLAVAVLASFVTSFLALHRAKLDRQSSIRLKSLEELSASAVRWRRAFVASNDDETAGGGGRADEVVRAQSDLETCLLIALAVCSEEASKRISVRYLELRQSFDDVDPDIEVGVPNESWARVQRAINVLVDSIIDELRFEARGKRLEP